MRSLHGVLIVAAVGAALALAGIAIGSGTAVLIGLCVLLGFCVKSTDQAVELRSMKGRRWVGYPLAVGIILITVYLSLVQGPVFGMVVGTAAGLIAAGKVDHPALWAAAIGFFGLMGFIVFILRPDIALTSYYLIPLAAIASFLDEHIHEETAGRGDLMEYFFEHRPVLKVAATAGTAVGLAGWYHLAGFFAFDIAYDSIAFVWQE